VLTTSLPFIHNVRRSYGLNGPVKCSDCDDVSLGRAVIGETFCLDITDFNNRIKKLIITRHVLKHHFPKKPGKFKLYYVRMKYLNP